MTPPSSPPRRTTTVTAGDSAAGRVRSPRSPRSPGRRAMVATSWRVTGGAVTSGRELAAHPTRVGDAAAAGWDDATALAKLVFTPPDARTAVTGETVVAKRALWSDPIPLDDVKAIGRATGATVNDVLLAGVTGALRR